MKKIAIIAHGLGIGGAERAGSILANGLFWKKYSVLYLSVYTKEETYHLDEGIEQHYIEVRTGNKLIRYFSRSKQICDYLDVFNPDCVISFITTEMVLSVIRKKYYLICSERSNPNVQPWKLKLITKFLYKRADRVVFQTTGAKNCFEEEIKKKSAIIPNPMNENLPYWDAERHNKTIITACRISPEKNLPMLISAFAKVKQIHKDYTLELYGKIQSDALETELVMLIQELGISESVKFKGHSSNIHLVMAQSGVFVLTSNYEGLSNSMLEALCIGVPTICTDSPPGGAAMYIKDGENGFLVDVGDTEALAQKLNSLIEDEELQKKFSENSIKLRDELAVDKIIEQWEALFI